jgi:hypothetical protein
VIRPIEAVTLCVAASMQHAHRNAGLPGNSALLFMFVNVAQ